MDGEFLFSELIFDLDGEIVNAICIEANEFRLLVRSDENMDTLMRDMDSDEGFEFETTTIDDQGNETEDRLVIDIEALIAYFMENDVEQYECQKNDLGDEGLCEAQESDVAIPLLLAYEFIRSGSSESIYSLLQVAESDAFYEEFDGSVW